MDRIYFIIPAYNEEDNVKTLINDWYPIVEKITDSRLVIINDGSKDNTLEKLYQLSIDCPQLIVLTKQNGGHGDAILFGYRYAIENDADWIFQTDSDGQTQADEFIGFWDNRAKYDAIIGNRRKRGDGVSRKIVEKVLCVILWIIFGVRVPDSNCPFRLMKANKVSRYIRQMPEHYYLANVMLTVYFVKNKDRVLFKEVTFENRKKGKGALNLRKIMSVGIKSIQDFRMFKKEMGK